MTIKGTIWTKRIVFNAARLAFLEVIPIHIPNQQRATRLAVLVARMVRELAMVVSHSCAVILAKVGGLIVGLTFVVR